MQKLIDQFAQVRQEFIESLAKFPKDKQNDLLFGNWNLKDVVAHFAGWDVFFTTALRLLKNGEIVPYWNDIDDFNKTVVKKRKTWNWDRVYKEFIKSGADFIKEYSDIPPSLAGKLFWQGKTYTPEKILKVNIHHYQKAQLLEIKKLLRECNI